MYIALLYQTLQQPQQRLETASLTVFCFFCLHINSGHVHHLDELTEEKVKKRKGSREVIHSRHNIKNNKEMNKRNSNLKL